MHSVIYQWIIKASLILLPLSPLLAQSPTTTLNTYLTAAGQNQRASAPKELWQNSEQHGEVLTALSPYFSDTLSAIRAKAYYLAKQIGTHSQDKAIRQQVVDQLTGGLQDEDSGIIGRVHGYLTAFSPTDFTAPSRQTITAQLSQSPAHLSRLLKLVGTLNLTEQVPILQNLLPSLSARDQWAAQLALARLGDPEALTTVLAHVKQEPVNDDVVYELLPDLVYTRQKAALDYLVTIVQSDEKNCQSADPEAEQPILCGYRVLELLAPVIQDFPLAVDESGDLAVSDYPSALQQARRWLREHNDYQIIYDS